MAKKKAKSKKKPMTLKQKIAARNRALGNTAIVTGRKKTAPKKKVMSKSDKAIMARVKAFRAGKNPDKKKKK